jgi:hypothetical protein
MKKILFLIFIFNIFYSVPSYASKVQNYVEGDITCATDANGAIYVNNEGNGDVSSFALASRYALDTSSTSFDITTRGNVNGSVVDIGGTCDITPDNYKLKFYKTGFCTENPYRTPDQTASNTINADLSSCINVFDNASGKEVNIQPDAEVDLLDGESLTIPIGTYPFQFAIIDNVVLIKHTQEFVTAPGAANFHIRGYKENGTAAGNTNQGKICYTSKNDAGKILVSTSSNELGVTGSTTLKGYTLPVRNTGVQPSSLFRCATAVGSGNAGLDWFATIINSFGDTMCDYSPGGTCTRNTSNFRNADDQSAGFHPDFPTISQGYYLLKSDNTIATTPENVDRILWLQYDSSNTIKITENTIGLRLNFKTNNAMQMQIHQDNEQHISNSDEDLLANQIHGGTIISLVQTKTRRSRGAWR